MNNNNLREEYEKYRNSVDHNIIYIDFIANIFDSENIKLNTEFLKKTDKFFDKLMRISILNNLSNTQYIDLIDCINIFNNCLDDFIEVYNLKIKGDLI